MKGKTIRGWRSRWSLDLKVARAGLGGFYSGVGALVAGNSLKAGVSFLSYDKFKGMLVDENVSYSLNVS